MMDKKGPGETASAKGSFSLSEEDLFGGFAQVKRTSLFLGRYSLAEVNAVLGRRNFFREAIKRNLWPLAFDIDSSEYPLQRFQIFYKDKNPDNVIVDLKIREGMFHLKPHLLYGILPAEYKMLVFEWLTLQNPLLQFSSQRSALPGQARPGLSLSKKIMDMFLYLARITGKDGLMAFPAYYHNAVLFSRYFRFVNPDKWAEVQAIHRSHPEVPLKQMAWIVHWNCLRDKHGRPYEWKAEEQVCALNRNLRKYFNSKIYKYRFKHNLKRHAFTVDWDLFHRKAAEAGLEFK